MRFARSIASVATAAPLLIASCGGESVAPKAPAGSGGKLTRTLLTDAPFPYDRVARVDLYVVSVSASLTPDTGSVDGFVTLATPNRRIDVLALQNGAAAELGAVRLPSGAVTAVRMVIDTDLSSITLKSGAVLTGSSSPGIAWQSSAGRPALNALIQEQILVPDSGATIVIDYDVGRAFIPPQEIDPTSTDSGFIFSPVLGAADAARTGAIAGTVRAHAAGGAPVADVSLRLYLGDPATPENTWPTLATARSDANGVFRFSFVTRSAYWASLPTQAGKTYIVAADPPAASGLGRALVPNLAVTAGAVTEAGVVVLP